MTPKDRSELIELMARAVDQACNGPRTPSYDPVYVVVSPADIATTILSALSESGLAIVPLITCEQQRTTAAGHLMRVFGAKALQTPGQWFETVCEVNRIITEKAPFKETVEYEPGAIR